MGLIPIDQVVTAQGVVVSRGATRSWCSRSKPRSCARSMCAKARRCRPARCWRGSTRPSPRPMSAHWRRRSPRLQAEVARLQAEAGGQPFTYTGADPTLALQAAIYAQRQAEYSFKLENYQQKINGLSPTIARSQCRRSRLSASGCDVATSVEEMRRSWSGCRSAASSIRWRRWTTALEMERDLDSATQTARGRAARPRRAGRRARRLYPAAGRPTCREKLSEQTGKLTDARENR